MRAASLRVEADEPSRGSAEGKLHKTICIEPALPEGLEKRGPVVMVANHEPNRWYESRKAVLDGCVSRRIAMMSEIPGHEYEFGVGVVGVDVNNCQIEPLVRIEAIEPSVRRDDV